MAEMGEIRGGNMALMQELNDNRSAKFAEADANADGLLNQEEAKKYHELDRAWRLERYGGWMDEMPEEEGQRWWDAMNGMSPEADGISLENHVRLG